MSWFRDRQAVAELAKARSEEALAEAEKLREQSSKAAEYLRTERARNHFSEDVRRAWRGKQ